MLSALLRSGKIIQNDLWSVSIFSENNSARKLWSYEIRRGKRKGLVVDKVSGLEAWTRFHSVLRHRLGAKYGVEPVHLPAEFWELEQRLQDRQIGIFVRDSSENVLAAMWFIDYGTGTLHNQYNCSTDTGLIPGAASFGVSWMLDWAAAHGFRNFSFGRSTLSDGWSINHRLLKFKEQFGAGLASQLHFCVDISSCLALPEEFP